MTAEVVIIGGGIVGSSIAYHLTEMGCRDVLILERETHQGKGSTGKSMGGVRAQFATTVNIQMSLYAIPFFRAFEEVVGHPSGYRDQGYLFVATRQAHLDYLRANFDRQVSLGLRDAHMISKEDIVQVIPEIRAADILGGSFCSSDGFVDPHSVMTGFTLRATERGVKLWREADVTGLRRDGDRVTGVETSKGSVFAPV